MSKKLERPGVESEISTIRTEKNPSRRDILKLGAVGLGLWGLNSKEVWAQEEVRTNPENIEAPAVALHIFYSSHVGEEDIKEFKDKIKEFDIYIPEGVGWAPEELADLESVSKGEISPQEYLDKRGLTPKRAGTFYFFLKAELEGIHGSKKKIAFVDIPYDHKLLETREKVTAEMFDALIPQEQEFGKFLLGFGHRVRAYVEDYQKEREKYIIERLEDLFNKIEHNKLPELADKKKITVLMMLGAMHTEIYQTLKRKKVAASRSFSKMPFVFDSMGHFGEMTRRYHFNKQVSDELAARTFAGLALKAVLTAEINHGELIWPSKDPGTMDTFLYKALSSLNLDEIQGVYVQSQNPKAPSLTLLASKLLRALANKDIWLPRSEQELKNLIGKV